MEYAVVSEYSWKVCSKVDRCVLSLVNYDVSLVGVVHGERVFFGAVFDIDVVNDDSVSTIDCQAIRCESVVWNPERGLIERERAVEHVEDSRLWPLITGCISEPETC